MSWLCLMPHIHTIKHPPFYICLLMRGPMRVRRTYSPLKSFCPLQGHIDFPCVPAGTYNVLRIHGACLWTQWSKINTQAEGHRQQQHTRQNLVTCQEAWKQETNTNTNTRYAEVSMQIPARRVTSIRATMHMLLGGSKIHKSWHSLSRTCRHTQPEAL